jgi:CopG family transcriptional regulator/antitoxin EndoAI
LTSWRPMLRNTKLISISIMPELLEKLNKIAKEESRTRSELLREAVRRYIEERDWQEITRYAKKMGEETGVRSEEEVNRRVEEYRDAQPRG